MRGGMNISPAEIDELLVGIAGVREAASVGVPAVPGTLESVLFEWLRDSRNPAFKAVQRLVV